MFPCDYYTTTLGNGLTLLTALLFGLAVLRLVLQAALASTCGRVAGAMLADTVLLAVLIVLVYQVFTGTGFLAQQVQDAIWQFTAPIQQVVAALSDPASLGF